MKKTKFKILSFILVMSFVLPLCPTLGVTAQEKTDALVVSEVTELRRSNEKHFLCSDGSVMAISFPEDVHYLDNNGKYVTIDNTLEYNSSKGVYRTAGNPNFKVSFANKANQPSYSLEDKAGNILQAYTTVEVLSLSASATREASLKTASLEVTNNKKVELKGKSKNDAAVFEVPELTSKLEYKNTYGAGISSEYIVDGNILKENIIFASPANYSSIKTTYSMEGLSLSVSEDGSLILYGKDGGAVFYVAAPYMYDAAGSVCPAVAVSASESGGVWTVSYVPDREWRNSSERVYPVTFDPATGSVMNSNITDKYSVDIWGGTTVMSDTYLKAGVDDSAIYRTYIKPTAYPTVPEGNIAVSAGLVLYTSSVVGSGTLIISRISSSGNFDTGNYSFSSPSGSIQYNSSNIQTSYTFALPSYEHGNCGNGYVILDYPETTGSSNYVVFHSSRAALSTKRPRMTVTYVADGINNKETTLYNPNKDRFVSAELTAQNEAIVGTTEYGTHKNVWKFVSAENGCFHIESMHLANKYLSGSANGSVSLVSTTTSTSAKWYVVVHGDRYLIFNEQYGVGLYIKQSSGTYACKIDTGLESSDTQRQWKMLNYVPKVATLSSVKNSNLVLRNRSGYDTAMLLSTGKDTREASLEALWQYKKDPSTLNSSRLFEVESEVYGDMYGFRLVLDENTDSYRIMPISSSNGEHRAAARTSNDTVVMDIYKKQDGSINTDDLNSMLFDFILRSDGKFHIKYHASSSPIYLSDRGEGIAVRLDPLYPTTPEPNSTDVITMQTWTLSDYEYKALNPDNFDTNVFNSDINIYTCLYTEIEEKCSEFGFSRPFEAGEELILTCDFGPREYTLITENDDGTETETDYIDVHKGIDLYTGGAINLYAPISGTVIYSGYNGSAGNAVVIDTGLKLSSDSNYTICIVYMHMSTITSGLKQVTPDDTESLGKSGKTGGNYKHHLHYGIFLKNSTMSATEWNKFPLNPLLFFTPIGYQENL